MAGKLPNFQFPGQVIIDAYGVVYKYDDTADCFVDTGSVDDIPDSSFDNVGLMTPSHKSKLDLIPEKAGGFAIVIDPKLRPNSPDNPDGLIYGDVTLDSESLDITCVDFNGEQIKSNCYNCIDGENAPGMNFQLSEKFLSGFCARLPIIPGPRGDKGETGEDGEPGTGDGPKGEDGDDGASYDTPGVFTGVKVLDVDGVYEKAVIGLDIDSNNGILNVLKSKVATGDETTPANQVYCTPIFRDVEFDPQYPACDEGGDLWKYTITKGDDELDLDPYLYMLPDQYVPSGETDVTMIQLSGLIDALIEDMKPEYEAALKKYNDQIKAFICEKDEDARTKLCSLAKEMADCEWELPLEYCVGITPTSCLSAAGKAAAALEKSNKIAEEANVLFAEMVTTGPFSPCPTSSGSSSSSAAP